MWGELNDFADVWIQPKPGEEAAAVAALDPLNTDDEVSPKQSRGCAPPGARRAEGSAPCLDHLCPSALRAGAGESHHRRARQHRRLMRRRQRCRGAVHPASGSERLGHARHRRLARTPSGLPGCCRRNRAQRAGAPLGRAVPSASGLTFDQMTADGKLKALVVMNDNPLMLAPDRARVRKSLESLDFLAVIDSIPTDTGNMAHVVLPDVSPWAKEGTTTSADRRVLRLNPATTPQGEARQGWRILSDLGARLAERLQPGRDPHPLPERRRDHGRDGASHPAYTPNATYREMDSGEQQRSTVWARRRPTARQSRRPASAKTDGASRLRRAAACTRATKARRSTRPTPTSSTARSTSASTPPTPRRSAWPRETRLSSQRPRRAYDQGASDERRAGEALHVPLYYDGGAVTALFDADSPVATVELHPARG